MSISSLISRLTGGASVPALEHDAFQKACLSGECHVIDVREAHEHASGHIPNAVNHPLSRFDPAQLPTNKPVVLVCLSGARSARALQLAQAAGRSDVTHYPTGTAGWKRRGGAIVM
jgi:rhodanese-related sulfurtransferase